MSYTGRTPSAVPVSVTSADIVDGEVTTDDIATGAVTAAKLASTLDLSGKTVTLPSTYASTGKAIAMAIVFGG